MAFDGIVISNIVKEMNERLLNGRIYKIAQPENDELIITVKNNKEQYKLLLSASASLPLLYFTSETKPNPMTAPNFLIMAELYEYTSLILNVLFTLMLSILMRWVIYAHIRLSSN